LFPIVCIQYTLNISPDLIDGFSNRLFGTASVANIWLRMSGVSQILHQANEIYLIPMMMRKTSLDA
jgi:hypothetical protein